MSIQPYEPFPLYDSDIKPESFPREDLVSPNPNGKCRAWIFESGYKDRMQQLASILLTMTQRSDAGKRLGISPELNSELMRILASACYLINSTSFREGKYFDFDREE